MHDGDAFSTNFVCLLEVRFGSVELAISVQHLTKRQMSYFRLGIDLKGMFETIQKPLNSFSASTGRVRASKKCYRSSGWLL